LNLKPTWSVEAVDYQLFWYDKDLDTGERILRTFKKGKKEIDSTIKWNKTLNALDYRWIVRVDPNLVLLHNFRDFLYSTIANALLNGGLSRISKCPECLTLFTLNHLNTKYCGGRCSGKASLRTQVERNKKWKKRKEERQNKQHELEAAKVRNRRLYEFYNLANKRGHTGIEIKQLRIKEVGKGSFYAGWKKIKEWQKGIKKAGPRKFWNALPSNQKIILNNILESF